MDKLYEERGYDRLIRALRISAEARGITLTSSISVQQQEQIDVAVGEHDKRTKHITCLAVLPSEDRKSFAYETILIPALRTVLEQSPYYWQVVRDNDKYFEETVAGNLSAWVEVAHAFIADISDLNPNVMMELGYMLSFIEKVERPLVVLERNGTNSGSQLTNLAGFIFVSYPDLSNKYAIDEIAESLRVEFAKKEDIQILNKTRQAHYLSSLILINRFRLEKQTSDNLSRAFITMENLESANVKDITRRVPDLPSGIASGLKKDIASLLKKLK
jgi:molecular chaperone HtpG